MANILSKEDRLNIINSHKRNLMYTDYNLGITLKEENAKSKPDLSSIAAIEAQMEDIVKQNAALDAEIALINAEPDEE